MPYVITRTYSRHTDKLTETEFTPILENGLWVGVAPVDAKTAKKFKDRPAFEVISEAQYRDILVPPVPEEPEPAVQSGDPLKDAATAESGSPLGDGPTPPGLGDGPTPPRLGDGPTPGTE